MAHDESSSTDRRTFMQAGALATASAVSLAAGPDSHAQEAPAQALTIPRRPLGKTGIDVTILDAGTGKGAGLQRILRFAYSQGIRCFDTSERYQSEPDFKLWFQQEPEVRKQIFVVTKDLPRTPSEIMGKLDQRLANMGTDYVDLFFIHSFGDNHSLDEALNFVKSREFKETADAIRKSGKSRLVGISTHHKNRAQILQAAAERGIVDAIMLQYSPWLEKDSPLNKAIDACWKKGIGLISMKQIAGKFLGSDTKGNILDEVARKVPMLAERRLTPFQGLLHAIWSDERISASCVSMNNTDHLRINADAARRFSPLKTADLLQLRDAAIGHGPMLCADCDGRCSAAAGTKAELGNLTRFLTYHEHHGLRTEARRCYEDLSPEARDWSGADLEAARAACPNHLDFAELLPEVDRRLA
jgi:aryl-alcohol dehydrogenase-like predicted oxidoreductase